jgi:hypothetical protein
MRGSTVVSAVVVLMTALSAAGVSAQPERAPLTPAQTALLCGPVTDPQPPSPSTLRVRGAQDPRPRAMFAPTDLLVIDGGTGAGVQLGQEYFVRRGVRFGMPYEVVPTNSSTVAWIRIVAVNESTAIASVQHVCDSIHRDDYLDPFVMPEVSAAPDAAAPEGELDFTILSRVVGGSEHREMGGAGDLMVMDRGTNQGVAPGARFAVYRDVKVGGMPLSSIGEAVVITAGKTNSVVQLTRTRDVVQTGDYLVPRK